MRSRSKLVAQDVPTFNRPAGVMLALFSFTAANLILTSSCLARAISHAIQSLVLLFSPTITNRCVADLSNFVKEALITAELSLSIGIFGPRLSKRRYLYEASSE